MQVLKSLERKQLPHLTGFRAIAAYLVLICHSFATSFSYSPIATVHIFDPLAYLGMSIFFVLSGFVITYTYYDRFVQLPWRQAVQAFAVARFARLYPIYIFCLFSDRHYFSPLVRNSTLGEKLSFITLTQSWWNMEVLTFSPSWSVSTECFFYLCFATWMLQPGASRHQAAYIRRTAVFTLMGVFLLLAAVFAARVDITACLSVLRRSYFPDVWDWLRYYSPYVRIGEFIAGACAARMFMATQHNPPSPSRQKQADLLCMGSGMAIIAFMIGNAGWFPSGSFLYFLSLNFGYAPFLAYIFYACSRYPNLLTRWCSARPMQIGGEISYSLYMLQFTIFRYILRDRVAVAPSLLAYEVSFLKALLYILLTTVAAYACYHAIEVPSKRFIKKSSG
jgi:peptidoglycan/LPS O-acetylase OafA/YrhL